MQGKSKYTTEDYTTFQSLIEDNARQGVKKFIHFKISLFQSLIEDNARKQLNHMFLR